MEVLAAIAGSLYLLGVINKATLNLKVRLRLTKRKR